MTRLYLNAVDFSICSPAHSLMAQALLVAKRESGKTFFFCLFLSIPPIRSVLERLVFELCNALTVTDEFTLHRLEVTEGYGHGGCL